MGLGSAIRQRIARCSHLRSPPFLSPFFSLSLPPPRRQLRRCQPPVETSSPHEHCSSRPVARAANGAGVLHAKGRRLVYLNFDGVALTRAPVDDATANQSELIVSDMTIPAWQPTDILNHGGFPKQAFVDEALVILAETWAGIDVEFVTERPPPGTDYTMIAIAGSATNCDIAVDAGNCVGYAPVHCGASGGNSVAFVFPAGWNWQDMVELISHETGHTLGLDHLGFQGFIMAPFIGSDATRFGSGATNDPSDACNGDFQDSRQVLLDNVGPTGQDVLAPLIEITSHAPGDSIQPGAVLAATVTDIDSAVEVVELELADGVIGSDSTAPYEFSIPGDIPAGQTTLSVRARDTSGNESVADITLVMEESESGCTGDSCTPGCDEADQCESEGGCSTGGASSTSLLLILALLAIRRTRR